MDFHFFVNFKFLVMKHFFLNSEFPLDEILFSHRNRKYGAYTLRRDADALLLKAVFAGVTLFSLIAVTPLVAHLFKNPVQISSTTTDGRHIFTNVEEQNTKDIIKKPVAKQQEQQQIKQQDATVPIPTDNPTLEKPMPKVSDYDQTLMTTQTSDGIIKPDGFVTPPIGISEPPVSVQNNVPETSSDEVVTKVEVEASYKGGIDAFRNKVLQGFNTSIFDGDEGKISVVVTFVVEKDGNISNMTAKGKDQVFNKEAIKTVQKIRGGWSPAKIGGKPVRSYFSMPISMVFE